jgi:hypothetical protein
MAMAKSPLRRTQRDSAGEEVWLVAWYAHELHLSPLVLLSFEAKVEARVEPKDSQWTTWRCS